MSRPTYMWHAEYSPEGQVHDLDEVHESVLIEQGWVDDPGKIGNNVWGTVGSDEIVARKKEAFDRGDIKAVGDDAMPSPGQVQENERLVKQLDDTQHELDSLKAELSAEQTLRQNAEKQADLRADAARQMGGGDGTAPPGGGGGGSDLSQQEREELERLNTAAAAGDTDPTAPADGGNSTDL